MPCFSPIGRWNPSGPRSALCVRFAGDQPLDPTLRDYILLITILVAFLEATALQLRPLQPPVVMQFGGIAQ